MAYCGLHEIVHGRGGELRLSEDRAAPLDTEVSYYISFTIHFLDHF